MDRPSLVGNTTALPWNLDGDQSGGYGDLDILTAPKTLDFDAPAYVNFDFGHPLSRVRIELHSTEFNEDELGYGNVTVTLNNFFINGSVTMTDGTAAYSGSATDITPYYSDYAPGGGGFGSYSAMVYPQTITQGTTIATLELTSYPNDEFLVQLDKDIEFRPGQETFIKVTLKKKIIEISATYKDWENGDSGEVIIQ